MQRALSIIAYVLFAIAMIAFAALLIVFPQVGTEDGTHILYALRRPVAVTHREYLLVMALLAGSALGASGGVAAMTLRSVFHR